MPRWRIIALVGIGFGASTFTTNVVTLRVSPADLGFELHNAGACRHAPGKIGDVGRIVACCLLDHDGVTHRASLLQTRLLQELCRTEEGDGLAYYHGQYDYLAAPLLPSAAAGWLTAHAEYGTLPLETLFAPAIGYATHGVPLTVKNAFFYDMVYQAGNLTEMTKAVFMPEGRAPVAGEVIRQPKLAATYARVAAEGKESFYRGALARLDGVDWTQAQADLDANANAVLIQSIKLENEGWERNVEVVEPAETSFTDPV